MHASSGVLRGSLLCLVLLGLGLPRTVSGQNGDAGRRAVAAAPVGQAAIRVDGALDEPAWSSAPAGSGFVQREPRDGVEPTFETEFRVLYDKSALWIGVRAHDAEPEKIVGQLTRRDTDSDSDWILVFIDSYCDRRTAFDFRLNAAGVKRDLLQSDDGTVEDASWDAIWDGAARIDSAGWTAEFRIPTSQLRYKPADACRFGFQVGRSVQRLGESSWWNRWPKDAPGLASSFGDLTGLSLTGAVRRLQILPYALLSTLSRPVENGDPFREPSEFDGDGGVDAKIGFGGNLTLDASINPDFGQVEADPSVVNLTAFETFYPEKRPFFIEGSNILRFGLGVGDGDSSNESLFYSRRIGRQPQGDPDGDFVDAPAATSIAAAAKLTGKTPSGWSVGLLDAVTPREMARVEAGGARSKVPVEPLSNYLVARLQRDLRGGRTALGAIATSVHRDLEGTELDFLRDRAITGGVDFKHRFLNDKYSLDGYYVASEIHGTREALLSAQRASQRYYQRPDADYVEVDSTRTSLTGSAGSLTLGKVAGGHWRGMTTFQFRSPGFESNDLGFLRNADLISQSLWIGYREWEPGKILRSYNINYNLWDNWSWGGDHLQPGTNVNGSWTYTNFWYNWAGVNYEFGGLAPRALRGGPSIRFPPAINAWLGVGSDSRKRIFGEMEVWIWKDFHESISYGINPYISFRPAPRWSLSLQPRYESMIDDWAWVEKRTVAGEAHDIMAHLHQETVSATVRLNYAFTPDLTLQLYAQPFFSAGRYSEFKPIVRPRAHDYDDLMRKYEEVVYDREAGEYTITDSGETFTIDNPDFNFGELRSNLVLRWEFRPGSALFLVWSQGRTDDPTKDGHVVFPRDASDLFESDAEDVFLAKLTYWLPI